MDKAHLDDLEHGRDACAPSNHAHLLGKALLAAVAEGAAAIVDEVPQGSLHIDGLPQRHPLHVLTHAPSLCMPVLQSLPAHNK